MSGRSGRCVRFNKFTQAVQITGCPLFTRVPNNVQLKLSDERELPATSTSLLSRIAYLSVVLIDHVRVCEDKHKGLDARGPSTQPQQYSL